MSVSRIETTYYSEKAIKKRFIENIHTLVNVSKSFPHSFKYVHPRNHSSVAILNLPKNWTESRNMKRLQNCFGLFENKFLLFSQEGITTGSIISNKTEDVKDISDPSILKKLFSEINGIKMVKEYKKENIMAVFGDTRIYATNICDITGYSRFVNPDFDIILYSALEEIEESNTIISQ